MPVRGCTWHCGTRWHAIALGCFAPLGRCIWRVRANDGHGGVLGGHEALLTLARHRPDLDAREAPLPFDDGDDETVARAADAAKANLRRDVAVVGTLDRDAAFLRLLALAAGWPTSSVCTHLLAHGAGRIYHKYLGRNRRPPAAELLGPELLAHVRHRLRGDLDLHAFAGQLLEDRLRAFGEDADAADATWRGACCTGLRVRVTPECLGGDSGPLIRPMLPRHKAGG